MNKQMYKKEYVTMYEYRFYTTVSTKPAEIKDEEGAVIGEVQKYYNNFWERAADILMKGRYIGNYRVYDHSKLKQFHSKRDLNIFKKRQYYIEYKTEKKHETIHLKDEKALDVGEVTSFTYKGEQYKLEKGVMDKARIKKNDTIIAEWYSSIKPPFKAYYQIYNQDFEEDKLLFLGLFHTYLHAA